MRSILISLLVLMASGAARPSDCNGPTWISIEAVSRFDGP